MSFSHKLEKDSPDKIKLQWVKSCFENDCLEVISSCPFSNGCTATDFLRLFLWSNITKYFELCCMIQEGVLVLHLQMRSNGVRAERSKEWYRNQNRFLRKKCM